MKSMTNLIIAVMVGALATVSLAASKVNAQEMQLRANAVGNEEGIAYLGMKRFAEIVEEKAGDKVGFKLFHSSALGDQVSSIESMQAGTLDIATVETPITTVDPTLGATALPYIFSGREHVAAALNGDAGKWIEKRLAEKGLRLLGFMEGGFRQITNNVRPIVTPADLKGVKMRTPGSKLRITIFNTYGANASPLPFKELYTALQSGVFDGQENPVIWAKATKFYEVQKYLSLTNHLYTVTYLLMSEDKFQQLAPEMQAIFKEAGRDAAAYSVEVGKKADSEIVDFLKEQGMEVNEADTDAFVKASEPIWDEWAEETGGDAGKLIELITAAAK
jgi:TRAP-type transport system periplasmic protein